jgi:MFS family permease
VLGNGGINAPLYIYVARWFDRRRGTALALISSGQSVAGAIWPSAFAYGIGTIGWRHTMLAFAAVEIALIVPAALWMFGPAPEAHDAEGPVAGPAVGARVLGISPGAVLGVLMAAAFCCCVPMAMPQGHLVALCSDHGIPASHGAAILSLLLASAFISRQFWGLVADKVGGLKTVLYGSACQLAAMVGFLVTQSEAGLIAVAAIFGFGFSGIIPAYVLAVRELFPAVEASWRVPCVLLCSGSGMAAGGWLAGIIYDHFGFYGAAFATGLVFNLANLVLVGVLVLRQHSRHAEPHHPLGTTWSMTDAQ